MDRHLDAALELKQLSETGTFEGMASLFGVIDSMDDVVERGAFSKTLKAHREKNRMPALLWQHDAREPIGVFREIFENDAGLVVKGELFIDDIPRARQAHKLMKENALSGLSIGFRLIDSEIDPKQGVRRIKEVDLFEVSLVTFPALDSARVANVKAALRKLDGDDIPTEREFEAFLRDAGLSKKQSKAFLALGYAGLTQRDADDGETLVTALQHLVSVIKIGEQNGPPRSKRSG